jgi:L-2-hydroxyglutarate oxidase LhgO
MIETDFLIIGAGIIGLAVAKELSQRYPDARILIIEKENKVARHASGRNSGVLHAGFYYHANSLKARFAVRGNSLLTNFCLEHGLSINRCGKVVVAKHDAELNTLLELKKRGDANKVLLHVIDHKELKDIEPNARTFEKALYSPTTATIDPEEICDYIAKKLESKIRFIYENPLLKVKGDTIVSKKEKIKFGHLINCAGMYSDKVAHQFGIGLEYTILPFKGLYIEYHDDGLLRMHVYPVPDLKFPFLGVHFTKTVTGNIKVGPTALPAFWRENYKGIENFKLEELLSITSRELKLLLNKSSNFRELVMKEIKKYFMRNIIKQAGYLVEKIETSCFGSYTASGIRAQLIDKERSELVSDFVVEKGEKSTHVLNAVSPAFTCCFPFARYIVNLVR